MCFPTAHRVSRFLPMSVAALSTEARWCRPDSTCVVAACSVEERVELNLEGSQEREPGRLRGVLEL